MQTDAEKLREFAQQIRELRTSTRAIQFDSQEAANAFIQATEQLADIEVFLTAFAVTHEPN